MANGTVMCANPLATLTTRPREARSAGSAAEVTRQGPTRLTSRTSSASASGGAAALWGVPSPALLISTSSPPSRAIASATAVDRGLVAHVADDVRAREVQPDDLRAPAAQFRDGGGADPARGSGDDDPHAITCSDGLKRAVRRRKRQVQSGHSVGLLPFASWYQLVQPSSRPCPRMRRCTSAL